MPVTQFVDVTLAANVKRKLTFCFIGRDSERICGRKYENFYFYQQPPYFPSS